MSQATEIVRFFVPGLPATAGSKKGFYNKKLKRVLMVPDNKRQKPWMATVAAFAFAAYHGELITGPVRLTVRFFLPRPKGHFGTGRNADKLKPSAPKYHTGKPDLSKMVRAVEDALSSVVWKDDSQVVEGVPSKRYGRPGAEIVIEQLTDNFAPAKVGDDSGLFVVPI